MSPGTSAGVPARWLAVVILVVVVVVVALRLRAAPDPAARTAPGVSPAAPSGTVAPVPGPAGSPSAPSIPAPGSPHDRFLAEKTRARAEALREIREHLSRGGIAALDHIARAARAPARSPIEAVRIAYLTRLIPFVAKEDPSCAPAALALAEELARRSESDPWVRFQALASLGGVGSSRMAVTSRGGEGAPSFHFIVDVEDGPRTEFDADLGEAGRPALATALPGALKGDASDAVRELCATLLGVRPTPEAGALLAACLRDDVEALVRQEALLSLARLRPDGSAEALRRAATADESPEVREAALRHLAGVDPDGAETASFLAAAALDPARSVYRYVVVEALFDGLAGARAEDYGRALVSVLLRPDGDVRTLRSFLDRAVEGGRAEFLPLLRAMQGPGLAEPLRGPLAEGVRKLEEAPRYAALARRIEEASKDSRALWARIHDPSTPPADRDALEKQAADRMREIWTLREKLRD